MIEWRAVNCRLTEIKIFSTLFFMGVTFKVQSPVSTGLFYAHRKIIKNTYHTTAENKYQH